MRCSAESWLDPLKDLQHGWRSGVCNCQHTHMRRYAKTAVRMSDVIRVAVDHGHRSHKEHESDAEKHKKRPARAAVRSIRHVLHSITITRIHHGASCFSPPVQALCFDQTTLRRRRGSPQAISASGADTSSPETWKKLRPLHARGPQPPPAAEARRAPL